MILFKDKLKTKLDVGKSGSYDWHVNPSTRPLVDPRLPASERQAGQAVGPGRVHRRRRARRAPVRRRRDRGSRLLQRPPVQGQGRQGHRQRQGDGEDHLAEPGQRLGHEGVRGLGRRRHLGGRDEGAGLVRATAPSNVESTTIAGPEFKPGKYVVRVSNFAAVEPYDGTVTFNKTPKVRDRAGPREVDARLPREEGRPGQGDREGPGQARRRRARRLSPGACD